MPIEVIDRGVYPKQSKQLLSQFYFPLRVCKHLFSYLSELPMRKIVCRIPRRGLEGKLYQINIQDNDPMHPSHTRLPLNQLYDKEEDKEI
ncbi:hypothetical protein OUZ56_000680 [Daphnia magna]|uniref:Uncharacterized protein n=1 Tax=Daphnia magna TaxID=35525 RepID=A0ABR0A0E3_9CRUS|nr:hypothetical protein OUZ56_000680 [Daphnia magna]